MNFSTFFVNSPPSPLVSARYASTHIPVTTNTKAPKPISQKYSEAAAKYARTHTKLYVAQLGVEKQKLFFLTPCCNVVWLKAI